eukprot:2238014-Ditylum_brightwellii.AAC.1
MLDYWSNCRGLGSGGQGAIKDIMISPLPLGAVESANNRDNDDMWGGEVEHKVLTVKPKT